MTPAEFKRKWTRYSGKESAAYQEHFNDLCRLLGQPTPVEADPSGNDFFCFQKASSRKPDCSRWTNKLASRRKASPMCGRRTVSAGNTRARKRTSMKRTSS